MPRAQPDQVALRRHVADQTIELLLRGIWPPGARLRDTELAERLGTSRTPAREALVELSHRRFLEALPGRGFRVPELRIDEVRELYPLVVNLECFALERSAPCSEPQHQALLKIESSMARYPRRFLQLDARWHEKLLAGCSNRRLESILADLRLQAYRYEQFYIKLERSTHRSLEEHHRISTLFYTSKRKAALSQLQHHWTRSVGEIIDELGRRTG